MNSNQLYISSLHRPFNTRLKTCKWVCQFAKSYQGNDFKNDFFIHIIRFLYSHYKTEEKNVFGLPSKETIKTLYEFIITEKNLIENLERFGNPSKKNIKDIDKKLFSNLKAVSYYITLAKNLNLIGSKYKLTENGLYFSNQNNSSKYFLNLTKKEKKFLFLRILENDLIPFLFSLSYYRLKKKHVLKDIERQETDIEFLKLLDTFLKIKEFKYKKSSWKNYIKVRESWIEDLELLSKSHYRLTPNYINIISENPKSKAIYDEILNIMIAFEKNLFKTLKKYRKFKINFKSSYKSIKHNMFLNNIGYVNLYDIKKDLQMSFTEFELMLNRLANDENNRKKVFFNNIIAAIDNRKRFKVNNALVLNIRITREII